MIQSLRELNLVGQPQYADYMSGLSPFWQLGLQRQNDGQLSAFGQERQSQSLGCGKGDCVKDVLERGLCDGADLGPELGR